jgi:hypothetical protein
LFFASPNGSSGNPTFRAIASGDIPTAATPASNGSCAARQFMTAWTSGGTPTCVAPPDVQMVRITSSICSTSGAETFCTMTGIVVWPHAFADTSYAMTCSTAKPTGTGTNPGIYPIYWANKTTTGADLIMQAGSASAAGTNTVSEIDCIGVHP